MITLARDSARCSGSERSELWLRTVMCRSGTSCSAERRAGSKSPMRVSTRTGRPGGGEGETGRDWGSAAVGDLFPPIRRPFGLFLVPGVFD